MDLSAFKINDLILINLNSIKINALILTMITVSPEDVLNTMGQENPWWTSGDALPPRFAKLKPRQFLPDLLELIIPVEPRREVILLGPRRVGKTYLIHHAIAHLIEKEGVSPDRILYLQLDNPLYVGLSLNKLLSHFEQATGNDWRKDHCFIFFDEIQYLKDWEVHLKSLHDTGSLTRFTVSGSAAAALSHGSQESGAGRFTDFLLPPLTFAEYLAFRSQEKLVEEDSDGLFSTDIEALNEQFLNYLNFGGYPEIALLEEAHHNTARFMRSDIIDKVLLRDLPSLYGITDVRELNRLFTMLAFNSGHELSMDSLAKNSAVAKNTIKRYMEYLEAAFLIRTVTRVDDNARRFKRDHTYKVYLTNPSLRTGLFSPLTFESEHLGHVAETAIFAQRFHYPHEHLHYARWKSGKSHQEVDLVKLDPTLRAESVTEVKFTDRVVKQPGTWKPWLNFCQKNNLTELTITTRTEQLKKETEGIKITFEPTALHAYRLGDISS